jgi:hypothetical protein
MAKDSESQYKEPIEAMRRLARARFENSAELQQLRNRIGTERKQAQRTILQKIADLTQIEGAALPGGDQRRREARRRQVAETFARLEARVGEHVKADASRFQQIRASYLKSFGGKAPLAPGTTQLKFRDLLTWAGDASPGTCTYFGSGIFSPWIGPQSEASADIASSTDSPGIWLHPRLFIDSNDCDDTNVGTTLQDVTYRMAAPVNSFGVSSVRVDLIANGLASCHIGDGGWTWSPSYLYQHSTVTLDAYIAQLLDGEWHMWPLLSNTLFAGHGDYVQQIRLLQSNQTYSVNLAIRGADVGGGDLLCFVEVGCSVQAEGTDGRVSIDFSAGDSRGMFVGGVALLGASL